MFMEAYIVNAFIDGTAGGNPAGVILNADRLNHQQKQALAKEIGVSETSFVSMSATADFKLEFFTPERQIAHCGHATIATFALLKHLGMVSDGKKSKETIDGNRNIFIDGNRISMEQQAPIYTALSPEDYHASLRALRIEASELAEGLTPVIVSTGNRFLILPMRDEGAVASLRPDFDGIRHISEQHNLVGFYPFSTQTRIPDRSASARMFAPRYGIDEEAATGMAAGPLACFLYDRMYTKKHILLIEQGHLMAVPSPSVLTATLDIEGEKINKVIVGGNAAITAERLIEVPMIVKSGLIKAHRPHV